MNPAKINLSLVELATLCDAAYGEAPSVEVGLPEAPAAPRELERTFLPLRQEPGIINRNQSLLTGGLLGSTPMMTDPTWFTPPPPPPAERKIIWKKAAAWRNAVGFYCATYTRADDGTPVLAFRGTDDLWDGLVDDTAVALGGVPPQVVAALQVARSARLGKDTYVTGHSLGEALAIITAAHLGVPAVTFHVPGVMDACIQTSDRSGLGSMMDILLRCLSTPRILNKRIDGDPRQQLARDRPADRGSDQRNERGAMRAECIRPTWHRDLPDGAEAG